jgi:putative redox protein
MRVTLKKLEGLAMVAKGGSNHWVPMDVAEEVGGLDAASRPLELMLMGIAGCAAMDVLSILLKKKVDLDDFEVQAEAEQAPDHPKIFTEIHIHYILTGTEIKRADVDRAIALTNDKYCGAIATVKEVALVKHTYEIKEAE